MNFRQANFLWASLLCDSLDSWCLHWLNDLPTHWAKWTLVVVRQTGSLGSDTIKDIFDKAVMILNAFDETPGAIATTLVLLLLLVGFSDILLAFFKMLYHLFSAAWYLSKWAIEFFTIWKATAKKPNSQNMHLKNIYLPAARRHFYRWCIYPSKFLPVDVFTVDIITWYPQNFSVLKSLLHVILNYDAVRNVWYKKGIKKKFAESRFQICVKHPTQKKYVLSTHHNYTDDT